MERKRGARGANGRRLAAAMALAVLAQCFLPQIHRWLSAAAEGRPDAATVSSGAAAVRNMRATTSQHSHSEADCAVCQALAHRIGAASVAAVSFSSLAGATSTQPSTDAAPRRAVVARHAPRSPPFLA